jgi:hypothetical protein
MKQSQARYEEYGRQRDQFLTGARRALQRSEQISNEIAAAPPAEEGILAGQDASEAMVTMLGAIMMSVGAGMRAAGGDMSGAEQAVQMFREMAGRQVRAQQRWLQLKGG